MARNSNAIPWAILVLISGGMLYRPLIDHMPAPATAQARTAEAAGGADRESSSGESQGQKSGNRRPREDFHKDALDLLADHFGIDVSFEALLTQVDSRAQQIARPGVVPTLADEWRALAYVLNSLSGACPPGRLAPLIDQVSQAVTSALAGSSDEQALVSFLASNRDILRKCLVDKAAKATNQDVRVETVIATVPDPIDSNLGWLFDPMVDAMQRAAAASSYVLDGFYVPDRSPERESSSSHENEPRGAHERWPGVLLFRDAGAQEQDRPHFLLVFLVWETATAGIKQPAFDKALHLEQLIQEDQRREENIVKVLGPTFSGSMDSLITSIRRVRQESGTRKSASDLSFRIVSGSATSPKNLEKIRKEALTGTPVLFQATVLNDNVVLDAIARYLLRIDPTLKKPGKVAILTEANTGWGSGIVKRAGSNATQQAPGSNCFANPDERHLIIDCALALPFPLHISRLRNDSQTESARQSANPALPQRFRALTFDDPGAPTDRIPPFTPKLTSSSIEIVLANIIDTLKRLRITTVGILATDTRDKLFLAEQLSRFMPGVKLFTTEGDVLFAHPDFNQYVRGMLVASSYPLFAQNQAWTTGHIAGAQLQQFATMSSEGIYNALLALTSYKPDGSPATKTGSPPLLLDYRLQEPCPDEGCRPAAWVGVVAHDAVWPVDHEHVDPVDHEHVDSKGGGVDHESSDADYTFPAKLQDAESAVAEVPVQPSGSARVAMLLFSGLAAASCFFFWRWRWKDLAWRNDPERKSLDRGAQAVWYQRVALSALALVGAMLSLVALLAMRINGGKTGLVDLTLELLSVAATGAVLAATTHAWLVGDETASAVKNGKARWTLRFTHLGGCAILLFGAASLGRYVWLRLVVDFREPYHAVLYVERAFQMSIGVSTLPPVLLLAAPTFCWALLQIWRVGGPDLCPVLERPSLFDKIFGSVDPNRSESGDRTWTENVRRIFANPTAALPWWATGLVFASVLAIFVFAASINGSTIEPRSFSLLLLFTWLLTQLFIVLTLVQSWHLWSLTRRLLCALAASPLADAFNRFPPEASLRGRRVFVLSPSRSDLLPPARWHHQLMAQMGRLSPKYASLVAAEISKHPVEAARPSYVVAFSGLENVTDVLFVTDAPPPSEDVPTELPAIEKRPWANTSAFSNAVARAGALYRVLQTFWVSPTAGFLTRTEKTETEDPDAQWFLRAEEFVAMLFALVVREFLARITRGLIFVTLALVFVVSALSSFPVFPLPPLMAFAWMWMVLVALAAVWISVAMERDRILSGLTGTKANQVTWDLTFVSKLIVYIIVPAATIFATQFPELGGALLRWLTPIQPLP
jgi:hypothetical protein